MELQAAYLTLSLAISLIIILGGIFILNKMPDQKSRLILFSSLLLWHVYLFVLGSSGVLMNFDFPPRIMMFMIFPAFILTGFFIYYNKDKKWLKIIPPHWLVFYQTFRVFIEIIFVFTVSRGLLHPNVTIEGYNYDMVFAFTAPMVGFLLLKNKDKYRQLAIGWNFLGLSVIVVIILLFMTTIYFPEMYGSQTLPFPREFGQYPYILVPGFLMPSAVFMHVLSIVQLRKMPLATMNFK